MINYLAKSKLFYFFYIVISVLLLSGRTYSEEINLSEFKKIAIIGPAEPSVNTHFIQDKDYAYTAITEGISGAIVDGLFDSVAKDKISNEIKTSFRHLNLARGLKTFLLRELAAISPSEVIPIEEAEVVEIAKCQNNYSCLRKELDVDIIIECNLNINLPYHLNGYIDSLKFDADFKVINAETQEILQVNTINNLSSINKRKIKTGDLKGHERLVSESRRAKMLIIRDYLKHIHF